MIPKNAENYFFVIQCIYSFNNQKRLQVKYDHQNFLFFFLQIDPLGATIPKDWKMDKY